MDPNQVMFGAIAAVGRGIGVRGDSMKRRKTNGFVAVRVLCCRLFCVGRFTSVQHGWCRLVRSDDCDATAWQRRTTGKGHVSMELKIVVGPGLLYQVVEMDANRDAVVHGKVVYTSSKYSQVVRYIVEMKKEVEHERSATA